MEIRKNFGKYWLAGLIFAVINAAIQWITSYLGTDLTAWFYSGLLWGLIVGVMGILLFIFLPWIYGRLIEWIYTEFILKK